jgi:hypothetical protein
MRTNASAIALTLSALLGCSKSGVERIDLSGTATYAGQPVPVGTISFLPAPGNTGPGGSAEIKDGKYDTASAGMGPTAGPHVVSILGFDGKADPSKELPQGAPLFGPYQIKVEVPKEGGVQNFDIPQQSAPLQPAPPADGRA